MHSFLNLVVLIQCSIGLVSQSFLMLLLVSNYNKRTPLESDNLFLSPLLSINLFNSSFSSESVDKDNTFYSNVSSDFEAMSSLLSLITSLALLFVILSLSSFFIILIQDWVSQKHKIQKRVIHWVQGVHLQLVCQIFLLRAQCYSIF